MDIDLLKKEIRFRCRRGLKETDILFARFIAAELETMGEPELIELRDLLHLPDQLLLNWFIEGCLPPDKTTPLTMRLKSKGTLQHA